MNLRLACTGLAAPLLTATAPLIFLAPPALAQGKTILLDNGTNPAPGTYGKSTFVDIDGDTYPDHVSLRDDEMDVRFALTWCEVLKEGAVVAVNDISPLEAADGYTAAIVTAKDGAVLLTRWNGDAFETSTIFNSGAKLVAVESSHPATILAVGTDKRSIHRLTRTSTAGGPETWSDELVTTESADVLEIESVNDDGLGLPEICTMRASGVMFWENDGDPLAYHIASAAQATSSTEGTTVVQTSGANQRVAVVVRFTADPPDPNSEDLQIISTVDRTGWRENTTFATDTRITGLAAADTSVTVLPQDELAVGWQYDRSVLQLQAMEDSDSPVFGLAPPAAGYLLSYGSGDATGNVAQPAMADVDGDGDIDTVLRINDTQQDFIYLNDQVDEDSFKPILMPGSSFCPWDYGTGLPLDNIQYSFRLDVGSAPIDTDTHLEALLYRKPTVNDPIDPTPVDSTTVQIFSAASIYSLKLSLFEAPDPQADSQTFESIYFMVVRRVEIEGGKNKHCRPPTTLGFQAQPGEGVANLRYLEDLPEWGDSSFQIGECVPITSGPMHFGDDPIPGGCGCSGDDTPCLPPPFGSGNPPKGGN